MTPLLILFIFFKIVLNNLNNNLNNLCSFIRKWVAEFYWASWRISHYVLPCGTIQRHKLIAISADWFRQVKMTLTCVSQRGSLCSYVVLVFRCCGLPPFDFSFGLLFVGLPSWTKDSHFSFYGLASVHVLFHFK